VALIKMLGRGTVDMEQGMAVEGKSEGFGFEKWEVRADASGAYQARQRARPMRDQTETEMLNDHQHDQRSKAKRCAICEGRFGLIRYYSSRTALCSRKCVDHFRTRRESDSRWLWQF
jgi:hypothetical protein